jgi:hypothetical protein
MERSSAFCGSERDETTQHALLRSAARSGNLMALRRLLDGRTRIGFPKDVGSALEACIQMGHVTCVVELVRAFPDSANAIDFEARGDPRCPLQWAVSCNQPEIVSALLNEGARADVADSFGETALHRAARQGRAACARVLLEAGAEADRRNNSGATPLGHAVAHGRSECLAELIKAEADIKGSPSGTFLEVLFALFKSDTWLDRDLDEILERAACVLMLVAAGAELSLQSVSLLSDIPILARAVADGARVRLAALQPDVVAALEVAARSAIELAKLPACQGAAKAAAEMKLVRRVGENAALAREAVQSASYAAVADRAHREAVGAMQSCFAMQSETPERGLEAARFALEVARAAALSASARRLKARAAESQEDVRAARERAEALVERVRSIGQ